MKASLLSNVYLFDSGQFSEAVEHEGHQEYTKNTRLNNT